MDMNNYLMHIVIAAKLLIYISLNTAYETIAIDLSDTIAIDLSDFNQKDSNTSCTCGLLHGFDKIILHATIRKTDNININNSIVRLDVNKANAQPSSLFDDRFIRCLDSTSSFMRCTKTARNVYQIIITHKAYKTLSNAIIQIVMSYELKTFKSNFTQLPLIFDTNMLAVYLNGHQLSQDKCTFSLNTESQFTLCCDASSTYSTLAVIKRNNETLAEKEKCASYKKKTSEVINDVTFQCILCNRQTMSMDCTLSTDNVKNSHLKETAGVQGISIYSENKNETIYITSTATLTIVILIVIILIYMNRKERKICCLCQTDNVKKSHLKETAGVQGDFQHLLVNRQERQEGAGQEIEETAV